MDNEEKILKEEQMADAQEVLAIYLESSSQIANDGPGRPGQFMLDAVLLKKLQGQRLGTFGACALVPIGGKERRLPIPASFKLKGDQIKGFALDGLIAPMTGTIKGFGFKFQTPAPKGQRAEVKATRVPAFIQVLVDLDASSFRSHANSPYLRSAVILLRLS